MNGFLLRLAISAFGLWLASQLVPGVDIKGGWTLLFAALWLGIVNALLRPIVLLITLPFTLITLGLFILVVNAAMFGLVAALLDDEATVKTFRQRDGHTWLLPQNSRYEPILGDAATVMGKVVSVMRSI